MNPMQQQTFQYWQRRYPSLMRQALKQAGVTGFGQTGTFSSIMSNLSGLLTSYGQYRIASDVANSATAANRNVLSLPGSAVGGSSTNWVLIGGVALIAVVGIAMFAGRRKKT